MMKKLLAAAMLLTTVLLVCAHLPESAMPTVSTHAETSALTHFGNQGFPPRGSYITKAAWN